MGYAGMNRSDIVFNLEPLNITIPANFTGYGGLRQFIAGNYTAQMIRSRNNTLGNQSLIDTVNASINFRVRHTTNLFKKNDIAKLCKDRFKPAFT